MMKLLYFFIFSFLISVEIKAQTTDLEEETPVINLEEVWVFSGEPTFSDSEAYKKYLLLKKRVLVVYPYAKMAADKLLEVQKKLDSLPNNRQKKRYTKELQKQIENQFTDELKKLSRSQGRILLKLIHRQTGDTAFNLIKELRSGWRAFWYNNTAWLYDLSLKAEYNPREVNEDFFIEQILQNYFSTGKLEAQPPAFEIDLREIILEREKNKIKKEL